MKLSLIVPALVLVAACGPTTHPPSGPHTEFPCGLHGRSCGGGMCCYETQTCGFDGPFSRCAPGWCCDDGGPDWPYVGVQRVTRQWGAGR